MHPKHHSPAERPQARGHIADLWSRRPLAGWSKSAANKLLSRRLERRRLNRKIEKDQTHDH